MKIYKTILLFAAFAVIFAGCKKDDYTGHATSSPTSPTITVDLGTIPSSFSDDAKSSHVINLSMSTAQIQDVKVYISVTGGDAVEDVDFSLPHTVTIAAGRTTASFAVTILEDRSAKSTRSFTIQIGDDRTSNANLTPVTADFTITNVEDSDMSVALSWVPSEDVYGVDGELIDPADLSSLFLAIDDASGVNVYPGVGEDPVTSATMLSTLADGMYYVTVGTNASINLGDQGDVDLDVTIDFEQLGVFTDSYEFKAVFPISRANYCNNGFKLLVVTKAGSAWTIDEYVETDPYLDTYGGTDGYETDLYGSAIEISACGSDYYIHNINVPWMEDWWGEEVINIVPLQIILNPDNSISIADQYYMTTSYDGALYDYNIVNVTGTWSEAPALTLHIEYDMENGGSTVASDILVDYYGYGTTRYFEANVVAGAANTIKKSSVVKTFVRK